MFRGIGRPAAFNRTSANGRAQEVTSAHWFSGSELSSSRGTGQGNHTFGVFDLAAKNNFIFFFKVGAGKDIADGRYARTSMRLSDSLFGIETVRDRPLRPHAGNGGSRINQHAIEIKKQSTACHLNHN